MPPTMDFQDPLIWIDTTPAYIRRAAQFNPFESNLRYWEKGEQRIRAHLICFQVQSLAIEETLLFR